jgi:hypothetical protein
MPANYVEVSCKNCGRIVRSTDRFCIFCGARMEAPSPPKPESQKPSLPKEEEKQIEQEVNNDLASLLKNVNKKPPEEEKKSLKPFVAGNTTEEEKTESAADFKIDLPEEIRVQLEAKMDLAVLDEKKKKLKTKLIELSKAVEEDRYEWDTPYNAEINTKLEALKEIKEQIRQNEEKLRSQLGGRFKMDEYDDIMEEKRLQLVELRRSYKMHTIKKEVYEQLKVEYTDQFREAEEKSQKLQKEIYRWLSRAQSDKNRIEGRIKVLKARLKTKEINQETFDTQKLDLEKELDKVNQQITILDMYAHEKAKKVL